MERGVQERPASGFRRLRGMKGFHFRRFVIIIIFCISIIVEDTLLLWLGIRGDTFYNIKNHVVLCELCHGEPPSRLERRSKSSQPTKNRPLQPRRQEESGPALAILRIKQNIRSAEDPRLPPRPAGQGHQLVLPQLRLPQELPRLHQQVKNNSVQNGIGCVVQRGRGGKE